MSFINNIITRHTSAVNLVAPRLPARFENIAGAIDNSLTDGKDTRPAPTHPPNVNHLSKEDNFNHHRKNIFPQNDATDNTDKSTVQAEIGIKENVYPPASPSSNIAVTDNHNNNYFFNSTVTDTNNYPVTSPYQNVADSEKVITSQTPAMESRAILSPAANPGISQNFTSQPTNEQLVIKVNIGRIEVRAINEAPQKQVAKTETPRSGLSLNDYLKKRNGLK